MRINNIEKFATEVACNLYDIFYDVRIYEKVERGSMCIYNAIAVKGYYIQITDKDTYILDHEFECVAVVDHDLYKNKISYSMALVQALLKNYYLF